MNTVYKKLNVKKILH